MTGDTLRQIREDLGYSIRDLAYRWGVGKSTLQREEEKDEIRTLYADAARYLQDNREALPSRPKRLHREKKPPSELDS